jgi:hypothetical protein
MLAEFRQACRVQKDMQSSNCPAEFIGQTGWQSLDRLEHFRKACRVQTGLQSSGWLAELKQACRE